MAWTAAETPASPPWIVKPLTTVAAVMPLPASIARVGVVKLPPEAAWSVTVLVYVAGSRAEKSALCPPYKDTPSTSVIGPAPEESTG